MDISSADWKIPSKHPTQPLKKPQRVTEHSSGRPGVKKKRGKEINVRSHETFRWDQNDFLKGNVKWITPTDGCFINWVKILLFKETILMCLRLISPFWGGRNIYLFLTVCAKTHLWKRCSCRPLCSHWYWWVTLVVLTVKGVSQGSKGNPVRQCCCSNALPTRQKPRCIQTVQLRQVYTYHMKAGTTPITFLLFAHEMK